MKLRIRLTITIGKESVKNEPPTERYVDQIDTHHDAGWVDTGLGFTSPSSGENRMSDVAKRSEGLDTLRDPDGHPKAARPLTVAGNGPEGAFRMNPIGGIRERGRA